MKSHKIQRLELVSDKIERGDSKRKVVRICFGCSQRKMALIRALYGRQPWPDIELHGRPWGLAGEEGRGREERGNCRGAAAGRRKGGRAGRHGVPAGGGSVPYCCSFCLFVRKKERRERNREKEKKKWKFF
jgi:hypothetical protein